MHSLGNGAPQCQYDSGTRSQTVTVEDILQREPTLHLRLFRRAEGLIQGGQSGNLRQMFASIFSRQQNPNAANDSLGRDPEENERIIRRVFAEFKATIKEYEDQVVNSLASHTEEEQDAIVEAFEQASQFLCDLMEWLGRVFDYAVERVRTGDTIDRDAVKPVFASIREQLNALF